MIINPYSFAQSYISGSLLFNSAAEYMTSSAASLLNDQIKGTAQKFSISVWIKRVTVDGTVQTIFSRDNNSGGRQFAVEFAGLAGGTEQERMTFFIADSATNFSWYKTTAVFTNTNNWYHVVITFDNTLALASKCKIYVNGVLETIIREDTGAGVSNVNDQPTEPIYINVTNFGGLINPFKGYSGRITFYTDILTQSDVNILFNGGLSTNDKTAATSITPYMQWNPGVATFVSSWTMDDLMDTSYPVSKAFVSTGLVLGDQSLSVIPEAGFAYNAASSSVFSAMTGAPGLRDKYIIDATIQNMINDGDWARLLDIGFTAAHDQQAARLRWLGLTEVTEVSSPAWVADRGYTGNGTSSYLNTGINPSTNGGSLFTVNSGAMYTYNRLNINAAGVTIGCNDATNGALIVPRNGGNAAARVNCGAAGNISVAAANSQGLVGVIRTGASAQAIWRNGASVSSNTAAAAARPNATMYVGANNNNGTAANFDTNQKAMWAIGLGGLQATFNLRVYQYMMSKGANV